MNDFTQPTDVSDVDRAFGGDMLKLLPPYKTIPDEFKRGRNSWERLVNRWFFNGLPRQTKFIPKEGIDPEKALDHVRAIMVSWQPKHEHKTAGCAYLLSLWFESVTLPD